MQNLTAANGPPFFVIDYPWQIHGPRNLRSAEPRGVDQFSLLRGGASGAVTDIQTSGHEAPFRGVRQGLYFPDAMVDIRLVIRCRGTDPIPNTRAVRPKYTPSDRSCEATSYVRRQPGSEQRCLQLQARDRYGFQRRQSCLGHYDSYCYVSVLIDVPEVHSCRKGFF
ncbi:hypothetical protein M513_10666 [Trichuris suis]|uniref:Uncharacterized protein n=1 Tax=Trichuris suis TaxID=68888 RepID=A0A085LU02_9BILA|nr:hypothetical protein M513_10666 [Trichuris suis]